jgi:hypothetical protein
MYRLPGHLIYGGIKIRIMTTFCKSALVIVCLVALAYIGWRFILPLAALYLSGVGIAVPLPRQFVAAYPRLAVYLFVFGAPILFVALAAALMWLLRTRMTPR